MKIFLCLNVPSTSGSFSAPALRPASWLACDVCSGHYYEWIRFFSRTDLGIEMSGVWDEWSQLLILWPHCKGNAGAGYSVIRHGPGAASLLRVSLYLDKSSRVNSTGISLPRASLPACLWSSQDTQGPVMLAVLPRIHYNKQENDRPPADTVLYSPWDLGHDCMWAKSLRCKGHPEIRLWPLSTVR